MHATNQKQRHTQRGEAQKQNLVNAAYDIIAEQGFEGLRTREVALRAQLNISTLHYYFASKEDLVRSVAQRLLGEFKTAREPQGAPVSAVERLEKEFSEQTSVLRRRPATYVVVMELFTRSLHDQKMRPIVQELLDSWEKHFMEVVTDGVRAGQIPADSDILTTTKALQSLLLGRALLSLLKGTSTASDLMFAQFSRWLSSSRR
ncbi:MAG TPA: TetR family transcriptional regulator [Spirochaetia bacterium]|nr:TetR family transcriptional regulator [Spirochaetia bacterium]